MVTGRKFFLALTMLSLALGSTRAQVGECPSFSRSQYYIHVAHTRTAANPGMDQLIESIDYSYFDMLWLGGDMTISSSLDDMTMDHIDSILDVANENTLWALGNHDYADLDRISAYTQRPAYYAYYRDRLTVLVLDTQDSMSNIINEQLELFNNVTDTLQTTTHLVILLHKLIWMYGDSYLQDYMNIIPNGGFGDCFYCINPNNFYVDLYPKLLELEGRGIEVICIAGDIGFRTNEFSYKTSEGVQFLASGIDAGKSNNQALVFRHDVLNDSLSWSFMLLSDLLIPRDTVSPVLYSLSISPDVVEKGDSIRIIVEAEDTLSGIAQIMIGFLMPVGEQRFSIDTRLGDWSISGGHLYSYDLPVLDSIQSGTWHVADIGIVDSTGNVLCLDRSNSELATFTVTGPLGHDEESRPGFYLYPNPSTGIIYCSAGKDIQSIDVYKQTGESLIGIESPVSNFIDLRQEAPGLYLVRFLLPGGRIIMKKVLIY